MHPFMIVGAVLHATAVLVIAFFIWFTAGRASGLLKLFGTLLGWWLVLLAVLGIGFAASGMGKRHMGGWMHEGPWAGQAPAASNASQAK